MFHSLLQGGEKVSRKPPGSIHQHSAPYSEYESRYGRHSDPLYSQYQPEKRLSGLDSSDPEYVYVDPHILATPVIADTNGDGVENELVIPVSYYFDPFYYGEIHNLEQLGGLVEDELLYFVGGGIVIVDLNTRQIARQKLLGITQANAPQPGYILSTPTVVKLFPGVGGNVVIIGSATGELHMLRASDLESEPGFPIQMDSVSAQVAVADLLNNGALELVVGDSSGNVYCIDRSGRRIWEHETSAPIISSARFADLEGDGSLEVILVTKYGSLLVLNGHTGEPFSSYPIHLNAPTESSLMLIHLNSSARQNALSVVVPTASALYVVDSLTGCTDTVNGDYVFLGVQADDVDPYSPGLELLAVSLDGHLLCYGTITQHSSDYEMTTESWPGEAIGQNGFTHKSNFFSVVLPHSNYTAREISGGSFTLGFELYDSGLRSAKQYSILVTIGRKYVLYNDTLAVHQKRNEFSLSIPTPPTPTHAFITIRVCNEYSQCDSISYNVKFNLHFQDNLKWFLALPFLALCAVYLWLLRDAGFTPLPMAHSSRKNL